MEAKLLALEELSGYLGLFDQHVEGRMIRRQEIDDQQFAILSDVLKTQIGLPFDFDNEEVFYLLDRDGNGEITPTEVLAMAYRLVHSELHPFQFNCALLSQMSQLTSCVRDLQKALEARHL